MFQKFESIKSPTSSKRGSIFNQLRKGQKGRRMLSNYTITTNRTGLKSPAKAMMASHSDSQFIGIRNNPLSCIVRGLD